MTSWTSSLMKSYVSSFAKLRLKPALVRLNDLDERRSILGLSNGLSQAASSEGKKPARLQPTSLMEEAMDDLQFRQSSSFKDDKFMKEESDIQVDNFSPPKLSMTRSSSILGGRRESNTCSSTSLFLLFVATNLKSERICGCSNLVVCLEEIGLATTKLRDFNISGCENIGALPKCINNFTSLRALVVRRCSADISFPEEGFPTNLTQLQISNAPRISSSLFDWGFHRLTSLQRLDISGEGCSNVVSFPEERMTLPRSLTSIYGLGELEMLRKAFFKVGGEDGLKCKEEGVLVSSVNLDGCRRRSSNLMVEVTVWSARKASRSYQFQPL
ncbi:hypothetical protein V6N11_068601 [Hibiscus sabdariffa]|uniref:Uncharacterized protein n=1 Tax=Hibiscus sabdariffa TaxID=183260 RepID=A0ABR2PAL9_9ROSI